MAKPPSMSRGRDQKSRKACREGLSVKIFNFSTKLIETVKIFNFSTKLIETVKIFNFSTKLIETVKIFK
jgi:hypothetical protein